MTVFEEKLNTQEAEEFTDDEGKKGLIATGGILGAITAASCCVLPLGLTIMGVSGAWMSNLRALAPFQPIFIVLTFAFLGYGYYLVYWKPEKVCVESAACARPLPNRIVKTALWLATAIVLIAVSFPLWFSQIEPYLP